LANNDGLFKRNPDFIFRKVVEETILVPVHMDVAQMDCIYTLNEMGAFIWEKLESPLSFYELQNVILEEYDVSVEEANSDLQGFLVEMLGLGAVMKVVL